MLSSFTVCVARCAGAGAVFIIVFFSLIHTFAVAVSYRCCRCRCRCCRICFYGNTSGLCMSKRQNQFRRISDFAPWPCTQLTHAHTRLSWYHIKRVIKWICMWSVWGKNKSSWNVCLMRHENHIKIEMMKQQKRAEEQQHHHFMMDDDTVSLWQGIVSVCTCPKSVTINTTTFPNTEPSTLRNTRSKNEW